MVLCQLEFVCIFCCGSLLLNLVNGDLAQFFLLIFSLSLLTCFSLILARLVSIISIVELPSGNTVLHRKTMKLLNWMKFWTWYFIKFGSYPYRIRTIIASQNHCRVGRTFGTTKVRNSDNLDLKHHREEWKDCRVREAYRITSSEWKEPSIGVLKSPIAIAESSSVIASQDPSGRILALGTLESLIAIFDKTMCYCTEEGNTGSADSVICAIV